MKINPFQPRELGKELKFRLNENDFSVLENIYVQEKFLYKHRSIDVYFDKEKILPEKIPNGTMLFTEFWCDDSVYILTLQIPKKDGVDEYRDILFYFESNELFDSGFLPDQAHSSVARKLEELGIKGPFEMAGNVNRQRALVKEINSSTDKSVHVFLDKIDFMNGKGDKYFLSIYSKEIDFAEKVAKEILSEHQIENSTSESVEELFFKELPEKFKKG